MVVNNIGRVENANFGNNSGELSFVCQERLTDLFAAFFVRYHLASV